MVHHKGKWVSTYWKPSNAIIGQSISLNGGRKQENEDLTKVKDFLKRMGIPFRIKSSRSSSITNIKRWVVIPSKYPLNDMEEQIIKEFSTKQTKTFHE